MKRILGFIFVVVIIFNSFSVFAVPEEISFQGPDGRAYRILQRVGVSSGASEVYEVQQIPEGKKLIAKIFKSYFPSEVASLPQFASIFRRNLSVGGISNEHILKTFSAGPGRMGANWVPVILMEQGRGTIAQGTQVLSASADRRVLEDVIESSFKVLVQIRSAIKAMHRAGFVHRDIKPANIVIKENGDLALIDFDLVARANEPAPRASGTPIYAHPEQFKEKQLSKPSYDYFGLAQTLFFNLTGQAPLKAYFEKANKVEVLEVLMETAGTPDLQAFVREYLKEMIQQIRGKLSANRLLKLEYMAQWIVTAMEPNSDLTVEKIRKFEEQFRAAKTAPSCRTVFF